MLISSFDQALSVKVKPSLNKLLLIALIHLAVCMVLFVAMSLTSFNLFIFGFSLACVAISFFYIMRLHIKLNLEKSIQTINRDINNNWQITLKDNQHKNVTLTPTSFISNFIVLLTFWDLSNKQNYTAVITPDSVSKDQFRRLKVLVKTSKSE